MSGSRAACVIGLGSMGYGAASSLLRAGFEVRGVDVREEVRARFAADGGTAFATPAEGAQGADAVLTFVVDADQTEAVLFGERGAAAALDRASVVLACATVPPVRVEEFGRRLAVPLLDAPVSGGAIRAAAGEMTVMASGSGEAFSRAEPFLEAISSKVYRLGDAPGRGSRVKMINQLLAGVHIAAMAEALGLGIREGIDPEVLYDVISNSAGSSWMFQDRAPHILAGDYAPRSAVDIFVKDLGIVRDAADRLGEPVPLATEAHHLFETAKERGLGRQDDSAVIKVYAADGGFTLPGAGD